MRLTTSSIILLLAVAVSQAIPATKIESSLKEANGLEKTQIAAGDDKDRAKKSAEFVAEVAPSKDQQIHQITIQPQTQPCGCNTQQLQSILLPLPQQVVQPVHTLHVLSPSQPCGHTSPTVNIVQPQTPAQPPRTLNIIQPALPCPQSQEIEEPEPEPEPQPEPTTEPTLLPDPEPLPEPIELEIVPVQQPCNEQMVVVPQTPLYIVPEVQPCPQHVVSECSCRQRNSGAYRAAAEALRYAPASGYRQIVPLTRTIRSDEEAKKE